MHGANCSNGTDAILSRCLDTDEGVADSRRIAIYSMQPWDADTLERLLMSPCEVRMVDVMMKTQSLCSFRGNQSWCDAGGTTTTNIQKDLGGIVYKYQASVIVLKMYLAKRPRRSPACAAFSCWLSFLFPADIPADTHCPVGTRH